MQEQYEHWLVTSTCIWVSTSTIVLAVLLVRMGTSITPSSSTSAGTSTTITSTCNSSPS